MNDFTQQGIAALKAGHKPQARQLLTQAVRQNKQDVLAWYALSFAVDKEKDQVFCLQQVLQLDPNHTKAQQRLAKITTPAAPEPETAVTDENQEDEAETAVNPPPPQTTSDRLKQAFLGEPHLPKPLTFLAILILLSDSLVVLTGQSASYWSNFSIGSTFFPWLTPILRIHPLLYVATILAMALILWVALRYLAYKPAIIIWMIVSYQHLRSFVAWTRCSLEDILTLSQSTCTAVDVTLTIAAGIVLGIALAITLLPRGISHHMWETTANKVPRISKAAWIASGIWLTFLVGILLWVVLTPPEGWILLNIETLPPARVDAGLVYDTDRQRAVLFGGGSEFLGDSWYDWEPLGDTWEWDGREWQEFAPQLSPPPRFSPAMAYDPQRKVTVLYGGITAQGALNDTWEWDGQQWQQLSPINSPAPVCCAAMFYDPQQQKIILHGGYNEAEYYPTDSWAWDGNEWQAIFNESNAPNGANFPFAYEDARNQAVALFPLWGTYTWHDQTWQQIVPDADSPQRTDAAMAYDPNKEVSILFGGSKGNTRGYDNSTWSFDGTEWEWLELPAYAEALSRHMMFYDETRGTIILFGGTTGEATRNAMWELHLP
ncbi:MAG: hypothetical protein IAF02_04230 [Anaerolineae bacterium]|nr:hypothetical protein [Anaerolineae bacterium]